jgi:GNAT superfamily N-acetyltransferase
MSHEWQRGDYVLSDDPARIDLDAVHGFLKRSYWAAEIPREVVARSIAGSVAFGLFHQGAQVGFARVVTDKATFAYLADVFIDPAHRGQGLSKWMMETILAHPELQGLRRWLLATHDAHGLYRQFGFQELKNPERYMTIHDPDIYRRG